MRAKLGDFGLAKLRVSLYSAATSTAAGSVVRIATLCLCNLGLMGI